MRPYLYAVVGGLGLIVAAFFAGRWSRPARAEQVITTESRETLIVARRAETITSARENLRWKTKIVTRPDGTRTEETEGTRERGEDRKEVTESREQKAKETARDERKTETAARADYALGTQLGLTIDRKWSKAGLVGLTIERRIVNGLWGGVWGQRIAGPETSYALGLSLRLEF